MIITSNPSHTLSKALTGSSFRYDKLLPGHKVGRPDLSWRTGDVTAARLNSSVEVWVPKHVKMDQDRWDEWTGTPPLLGPQFMQMTQAAQDYWSRRQDGAYIHAPGVLAACDGSVEADMGAAAVVQLLDCTTITDACKVEGDPSSFRAEAAGMHMSLVLAPTDEPLTILTDSMNVVYAMQAFNTLEFARDMR